MSEPINRYTMPIQGENLPRKCLRVLARWRTTDDRGKPSYLLSGSCSFQGMRDLPRHKYTWLTKVVR
jgi:hypothetical protein